MMPEAGGGRKPKDPRNISDKSYMHRSIRKLIHYLAEHGYDRAISPQILTAPTTKDFVHILSFLLRSIDPNFKFAGKYEDELPGVLRSLGYPYNVSKSALQAVGSPHTWPHLLAALSWLVDLLKYAEVVFEPEAGESFDNDDGNKLFIDYLTKGYQLFLSGDDSDPARTAALEEQIQFIFDSKNSSLSSDIRSLEAANKDLSAQHAALSTGDTPLQKAQQLNADLRSDTAKFDKFIGDLKEHRQKLADRVAAEEKELGKRQQELAAYAADVDAHKATISRQELTPADVTRMRAEHERLKEELASLKASKEAQLKDEYEAEVGIGKAVDRLEAKVAQGNAAALRLQLAPADAKNAGGTSHHVELHKHALESNPEGVLSVSPSGTLAPALVRLKAAFGREHASAQDALLDAEAEETRRDEAKAERLDELRALKADFARAEREEKVERERQARELAESNRETQAIQEKILAARGASGSSLLTSQGELSALQKEYDEFVSTSKHTREKM